MTDNVLYAVSEDLLAEFGLQRYGVTEPSYRCDDADVVLVPIDKLKPPILAPDRRGLAPKRLRQVLAAISTGHALPAIPVFREDGAAIALILDGAHRYFAAVACGFTLIPCKELSREEAELGFRYPDGQL